MNTIAIQPTKWSAMPDVDSVNEFCEKDTDCLRDLRDVLKKYDCLDRFGISLLHTHFDVAEDELLLETTDTQERTQIVRPVKTREYHGDKLLITALKLVDGEAIAVQNCGCGRDKDGHTGKHPRP